MPDTLKIPLTQGKVALIDATDAHLVTRYKWYAFAHHRTFYARSNIKGYIHRLIMKAPGGMEVDHINGDGLDNRRCNLRLCTRAENGRNRKPNINSVSRYLGVWKDRRRAKCWVAMIGGGESKKGLGSFYEETDAARAYDNEAIKRYGEFARLNFPKAVT